MTHRQAIVSSFVLGRPHFGEEFNSNIRMARLDDQGWSNEAEQYQGRSSRGNPDISLFVPGTFRRHPPENSSSESWDKPFEHSKMSVVDTQLERPISHLSFWLFRNGNANASFSINQASKIPALQVRYLWGLWTLHFHSIRNATTARIVASTRSIWTFVKSGQRFFHMTLAAHSCFHRNIVPQISCSWEETIVSSLARGGG